MFDKLRNAFSSAVKSLGEKELKEKDIDEVLSELELALLESDVAVEVIDSIKTDLKRDLVGVTVQKNEIPSFVKEKLVQSISNIFEVAGDIDIINNVKKKKENGEPCVILFMGINGTGKTTTIAKFANLLRANKFSSVIAAADTYRAGAIEQIMEHGRRLNIKVVAQNYGSDPAAVARDALLYAKSHKIDVVLIDTAGRMQTSRNLMDQISKINKVVNPDIRLFVGDSLAGNDTVSQAREFYKSTKFDGVILTKSDADARGGAAISITKVTSSPILYLGVGQEYKDIKPFDKDSFLESLFGQNEGQTKFRVKPPSISENLVSEKNTHDSTNRSKKEIVEPTTIISSESSNNQQFIPSNVNVETNEPAQMEKEIRNSLDEPTESDAKIKPSSEISLKTVQDSENDDPFFGIATKDIEKFSEIFDIRPPDNDVDARKLAGKIRNWISEGRSTQNPTDEINEIDRKNFQDGSTTKKRSIFKWMKK